MSSRASLIKYRQATEADLPELLRIGRDFADACALDLIAPYDPASCERLLRWLIDDHILIVADDGLGLHGCAAAAVTPWIWNAAYTQASELFWWVDPPYRAHGVGAGLLQALETEAKSLGATIITMVSMTSSMPDKVFKMYTNAGYKPSEQSFLKVTR